MDKKTYIYHFWGKKPTKQNTTQQKPKLPSESCLIFLVISFPCHSCKDRRGFWVGDWRPWLDSLLCPLLANPTIEQMWNLSRLLSCSCSQLLPGEEQVSPGSPLPQKGSWVCLFTGQMYIDFFFFLIVLFFLTDFHMTSSSLQPPEHFLSNLLKQLEWKKNGLGFFWLIIFDPV